MGTILPHNHYSRSLPYTIVAIIGPTASGKTSCAIDLAEQLGSVVLSIDARQLYKGMEIGTAQPSLEERRGIPHHFIGSFPISFPYSAGSFGKDVQKKIDHLWTYKKNPETIVAVGGSGLYLQALSQSIVDIPAIQPSIREDLNNILEKKGLLYLVAWLEKVDPSYTQIVDKKNPRRIIRALEVCLSTGKPYSQYRIPRPPLYHLLKIGIEIDKQQLHRQIDLRVEEMIEKGLCKEVEKLYPFAHTQPLQTIGYQEIFAYMRGLYSKEKAIEWIKIHTKQYAKRQLTWFKKDPSIHWIESSNHLVTSIQKLLEKERREQSF